MPEIHEIQITPRVLYEGQSFDIHLIGTSLETYSHMDPIQRNLGVYSPKLQSVNVRSEERIIELTWGDPQPADDGFNCYDSSAPISPPLKPSFPSHVSDSLPPLTAGVWQVEIFFEYHCHSFARHSAQITVHPRTFDLGYREPELKGRLENPPNGGNVSGIGLVSGWACYEQPFMEIGKITISIDDSEPVRASYGTSRSDAIGLCATTHSGYGLLVNWNLLGDGEHTIKVFADGVQFGSSTFNVTTLGQEFLRGVEASTEINNFPESGNTARLSWEQSLQNFVIEEVNE